LSPFLFKLRAPHNAICGFAYFASFSKLPAWLAGETFGAGKRLQAVGPDDVNYYSDFNPFDRTDASDRAQRWQIPGWTLFDLHGGYDIDLPQVGSRVKLFANGSNLFDEPYVQDTLDNSSFLGFDGDHDANDAEVFVGLPRTFTIGVQTERDSRDQATTR
jgi:outer membrane receptor protein involved in Fe transport